MAPGRSRLDFDGSLLWFRFNPWSWDLWPEKKKKKKEEDWPFVSQSPGVTVDCLQMGWEGEAGERG